MRYSRRPQARTAGGSTVYIIAVNLAILVVLLGGAEFALRAIQARRLGPEAMRFPNTMMDRWTGWRNTPGYKRVDIRHNAAGFRRDEETAMDKPSGTVRIFLLGGSTAYGSEGLFRDLDPDWQRLDNRDLVDANLERLLRKNHPERHWEVINAATNEFRMHQHFSLIPAKLLAYKPDFMIFLDGHNDLSGLMDAPAGDYNPYDQTPHEDLFRAMVYPKTFASWLVVNSTWLRNNSVAWTFLQDRFTPSGFKVASDTHGTEAIPVPVKLTDLDPAQQQQARDRMQRAVYYPTMAKRLQNELRFEGIPALFSMQPELILSVKPFSAAEKKFADYMRKISGRRNVYLYENLRPEISRLMAQTAQEQGFVFVDLQNAYDDTSEKTFTDYCHLTPKGNQLVAQRLYATMEPRIIAELIARAN